MSVERKVRDLQIDTYQKEKNNEKREEKNNEKRVANEPHEPSDLLKMKTNYHKVGGSRYSKMKCLDYRVKGTGRMGNEKY